MHLGFDRALEPGEFIGRLRAFLIDHGGVDDETADQYQGQHRGDQQGQQTHQKATA
ncbi:hypothetical protein [Salinicola halimionae]|uniref:hypothetical protein n=1 Tax=Salinicola halimionae TaxID=1949081 RepID=UPI00165F32E9|nr:hypothetical protein [Salinicola halimionae]